MQSIVQMLKEIDNSYRKIFTLYLNNIFFHIKFFFL